MKKLFLVLTLTCWSAPAFAQRVEAYVFEHVPFSSGLRATSTSSLGALEAPAPATISPPKDIRFGVALAIHLTPAVAVEVMGLHHTLQAEIGDGSRRATIPIDLDATAWFGHVLYTLHPEVPLKPFIFAGVGVADVESVRPPQHETRLIYDVGTGIRYPLTSRLGVRLQVRISPSIVTGQNQIERQLQGRSGLGTFSVDPASNAVTVEAHVGLSLRF